jgi:hypothetical protein
MEPVANWRIEQQRIGDWRHTGEDGRTLLQDFPSTRVGLERRCNANRPYCRAGRRHLPR